MTLLDRLSTGWRAWVLLALITLGAAAPGVFLIPVLDRDEARFAQASKQMLETGDFVVIRYQDELRNKKPVGVHWLQAAATAATTGPEAKAIWTYRLPSWLGAAGAALACFWAGLPLVGRRASFLGAALFGATILLTSEAHIAKTDAMLAFVTTLGLGALGRLYVRPPKRTARLAAIFWLSMAAGFLLKGPVSLLVAGLTGLGLWLWDRRRLGKGGRWWRPLARWWGPALFAAVALPWFVWIELATGGAFLQGAVGQDLGDKVGGASEGHGGLPGYHLLVMPLAFFPAALLLGAGLMAAMTALRGRTLTALGHGADGLRFLLAWGLLVWLFFELLPTKLPHYLLPAYPAFALLCGFGAVQLMDGQRMPRARGVGMVLFAFGAALLLIASYTGIAAYLMEDAARRFTTASHAEILNAWESAGRFPLWLWWAGFTLVGLALIESARRRTGSAIVFAVLASLAIGWHIRAVMLPAQDWLQPTEAARKALEDVCGVPGEAALCNVPVPDRVLALGYSEASYVMSLGTQNLHPPRTQRQLPASPDAYPVVYLLNFEDRRAEPVMTAQAAELRAEARRLGLCLTESGPHYALNYSNGRPVHFRAWRFDQGACP